MHRLNLRHTQKQDIYTYNVTEKTSGTQVIEIIHNTKIIESTQWDFTELFFETTRLEVVNALRHEMFFYGVQEKCLSASQDLPLRSGLPSSETGATKGY